MHADIVIKGAVMDSSNKNNKDNKKVIRSNHAPRGSANFLDEEVKNVLIELSILKLEMKKRELLEKYYKTDYYKSGKDKRNKQ